MLALQQSVPVPRPGGVEQSVIVVLLRAPWSAIPASTSASYFADVEEAALLLQLLPYLHSSSRLESRPADRVAPVQRIVGASIAPLMWGTFFIGVIMRWSWPSAGTDERNYLTQMYPHGCVRG